MGRKEKEEEEEEEVEQGKGFFACYLLTSLSPRFKGHTYIGFTVNPRRRIRQHNGEIGSGAWRTKTKRPWEMVLCIYGFPTNVSALKFEWAWQHPKESLNVREAAAGFKSLSGLANKIKLAYTMLTLPAWQSLNITVNYFSTKYKKHSAGCPSLPEHMKVKICPLDELPCYTEGDKNTFEQEDDWDDYLVCDEDGTANSMLQETATDATAIITGRDTENPVWIEDYGKRQPTDSPTSGKDCTQPIDVFSSPARISSSIVTRLYDITETGEDRETFGWIEDCGKREPRDSATLGKDCSQPYGFINSSARVTSPVATGNSNITDIAEDKDTFEWIEDYSKRQLRESASTGKDCRQPFGFIDSPARISSSIGTRGIVTSCSSTTATAGDRDRSGLLRESSVELGWSGREELTTAVAADKDVHSTSSYTVSREVEIIDVFTPSPDCRVGPRGKKRRVACPEIIDLTRSPIFVQL